MPHAFLVVAVLAAALADSWGARAWAAAPGAVGTAAAGEGIPPARVAEGHLRRARELGQTGCKLESECDWRAVDAYYTACEEAWNAVWTCPESRDILCAAAEVYADALQGLLESAACHGRLSGAGSSSGPAGGRWSCRSRRGRCRSTPLQSRRSRRPAFRATGGFRAGT